MLPLYIRAYRKANNNIITCYRVYITDNAVLNVIVSVSLELNETRFTRPLRSTHVVLSHPFLHFIYTNMLPIHSIYYIHILTDTVPHTVQ